MMWEIIEGTFWEAYFQNKLPICPKLEQNVMILGAKFSIFFSNYLLMDINKPQNYDLPNQVAQLVRELLDVK